MFLAWLLCAGAGAPAAVAAEERPTTVQCPICHHERQAPDYRAKAAKTLLRGATNTFLGWTEVIYQPGQAARRGENAVTGIAKGLGSGVTRTLTGAAELLTFWMPKVNNRYLEFATDCPICMGSAAPQADATP